MAEPGDCLCSLFELLGFSTEGAGERVQAIALLVLLVLFGLIAAIFTVGLARQLWGGTPAERIHEPADEGWIRYCESAARTASR